MNDSPAPAAASPNPIPAALYTVDVWNDVTGWESTHPDGVSRSVAWEHCKQYAAQPVVVGSEGRGIVWQNEHAVTLLRNRSV